MFIESSIREQRLENKQNQYGLSKEAISKLDSTNDLNQKGKRKSNGHTSSEQFGSSQKLRTQKQYSGQKFDDSPMVPQVSNKKQRNKGQAQTRSINQTQVQTDVNSSNNKYQNYNRNLRNNTYNERERDEFHQDSLDRLQQEQYYGAAIRELEEFLDPNVLNDEEFALDKATVDQLQSLETQQHQMIPFDGVNASVITRKTAHTRAGKAGVSPFKAPSQIIYHNQTSAEGSTYDAGTDISQMMKNPLVIPKRKKSTQKSRQRQKNRAAEHDMFLLNVRLQMQSQQPVMTHTYGYNDTQGDLRVGGERGSKGHVQPNVPVNATKQAAQRLIFDPQNPNISASQKLKLIDRNSLKQGINSSMLTSTFENQYNGEPNAFESVKNSLFEHKKASLRTGSKANNAGASFNDQGLPQIHGNRGGYSDNNSATNIKKKKAPGAKPFISPRQTMSSQRQAPQRREYGQGYNNLNKTHGGSMYPQVSRPATQDLSEMMSTPQQMKSGIHTKNYQQMQNPNQNLKLKKGKTAEVAGGNKIILKKINKFYDNDKVGQTYAKETMMSGHSSDKNDFVGKTFQKNSQNATSPRSIYAVNSKNSLGKKKSNLPEVENSEKLKYSPREKLRSSKMEHRKEQALEDKIVTELQEEQLKPQLRPVTQGGGGGVAIPKLNWQGQQDSSIFDENNSSTLQQPPLIESTGLPANLKQPAVNKKESEHESRNLGTPLTYLQRESDQGQYPKAKQLEKTRIIKQGTATAPVNKRKDRGISNQGPRRGDKNLMDYLHKKMKPGDKMQFNQAIQNNIRRPVLDQQQVLADRSFEQAYLRNKREIENFGKARNSLDQIRNKSAPKRKIGQQERDAQRAMGNSTNRPLISKSKGYEQGQLQTKSPGSTKNKFKQTKYVSQSKSNNNFDSVGYQTQTIKVKKPVLQTALKESAQRRFSPPGTAYKRNYSQKKKFRADSSLFSILKPVRAGSVSVNNDSQMSIGRNGSAGSQMSHGGELSRMRAQHSEAGKQFALLDQKHLEQLQIPENIRNSSLYLPEGYSKDHSRDLQNLKFNRSNRALDSQNPMRAGSAKKILEKAMTYQFKLQDLNKYSKSLKFKDINWKIKLSALGKVIPDVEQRKKILFKGSHFNTLLRLLRATDWSQTPVYYQYIRNGRWQHEDERIYSEIELSHNMNAVHNVVKMLRNEDDSEEEQDQSRELNELYYEKTMHTMEVLMSQMNLMYYCEKVRLDFADHEPNLQQLEKLMSRSLKMYHAIDSFTNIFKLIHKKEKLDLKGKEDETLEQRLKVSIALLLKENPVLPNKFRFKGKILNRLPNQEQSDDGRSVSSAM